MEESKWMAVQRVSLSGERKDLVWELVKEHLLVHKDDARDDGGKDV